MLHCLLATVLIVVLIGFFFCFHHHHLPILLLLQVAPVTDGKVPLKECINQASPAAACRTVCPLFVVHVAMLGGLVKWFFSHIVCVNAVTELIMETHTFFILWQRTVRNVNTMMVNSVLIQVCNLCSTGFERNNKKRNNKKRHNCPRMPSMPLARAMVWLLVILLLLLLRHRRRRRRRRHHRRFLM